MILDTQYLGALVDGDAGAREKATELDAKPVPTRVPTAVVWEAYTGIGNADIDAADELRALYERLLASRSTLDLAPEVARRAGELNGEHLRSDELAELDGADSVVAAHGLLLDEAVVSNDADFRDVDGLDVVTY
ncbi:PIN domain-containing protein [Halolamina sp. CBA1230]|uniref:PIN domain-containing protein n=1 Tax=Halolamina sp. CBA1230 TaxID=1853690 RepID=UPI0009A1EB37|nr:PIN domain-containing protein [Halolamina sp. CBA1230]QKY20324.1 PIN domain-containing protein [Halolamina sp. CBA1230]